MIIMSLIRPKRYFAAAEILLILQGFHLMYFRQHSDSLCDVVFLFKGVLLWICWFVIGVLVNNFIVDDKGV